MILYGVLFMLMRANRVLWMIRMIIVGIQYILKISNVSIQTKDLTNQLPGMQEWIS